VKLIALANSNQRSRKLKLVNCFLRLSGAKETKLITPNTPLVKAATWNAHPNLDYKKDAIYFMFGHFGVCPIINKLLQQQINFIYVDNGYLYSRYKRDINKQSAKYSFTINNTRLSCITKQIVGDTGVEYVHRKPGGDYILVVVPSEYIAVSHGFKISDWLEKVKRNLEPLGKPFVVRTYQDRAKKSIPFESMLDNACLTVTSQSLTGLDSLKHGVPVISDSFSLSNPVSGCIDKVYESLDDIYYPDDDRFNRWVGSLASNEFSMNEFKNLLPKIMKLQHMSLH